MNKRTVITIASVALLIIGCYYLYHYTSLFKKGAIYYSSFSKISGLQESGPVLINGVRIGKVSEIEIGPDRNILVTYTLNKDQRIPNGTIAKIVNGDISGTKAVKFYLGKQPGFIPVKGTISTVPDTTMIEVFNAKITPIVKGGKFLLRTVDSSFSDINYLIRYGGLGNKAQQRAKIFRKDLEGFARTSKDISTQIDKFNNSISSLSRAVQNPERLNADVNDMLTSGSSTTKNLSQKDYDSLLKQTASSFTRLTTSIKKISNENKLFKDKATYQDANRQLDTANQSMTELMKDPPGIQLIGGGKKKNK